MRHSAKQHKLSQMDKSLTCGPVHEANQMPKYWIDPISSVTVDWVDWRRRPGPETHGQIACMVKTL